MLYPRIAWMFVPARASLGFGAHYIGARREGATSSGYSSARFLVSNLLWHFGHESETEPIRQKVRDFQVTVNPVDEYEDTAERLCAGSSAS